MYELSVETEFCAAHAIVIAGRREPVHGHNWHVTATIESPSLDADGLICDFHAVEHALREITAPFTNADLNATPPFNTTNPTAEHVAKHIGDQLAGTLGLPQGARVSAVRITEAPGCAATYRP